MWGLPELNNIKDWWGETNPTEWIMNSCTDDETQQCFKYYLIYTTKYKHLVELLQESCYTN